MNKQKIAIMTDSCADIPPELAEEYGIFTVPLKIIYSDGVYSDGVDIRAAQVYERLPREIPKTSLPEPETVERLFAQIREAGYERVLAVIFSSGLSGTWQMVKLMGGLCERLQVHAVDTLSGSLGAGAIALQAAQYVRQGKGWEELLGLMPRLCANTKVFFCVDTLEYLKKGGRIGLVSSTAATMLNIKPVISFAPDGQLTDVARVRGRKASIERLVELVCAQQAAGRRYNIMYAHGEAPEEGELVGNLLKSRLPDYRNCWKGEIDCTLGTYVGPHLLGAGIQFLDADM